MSILDFFTRLDQIMNHPALNQPIGNDLPEQGGITGQMNQGDGGLDSLMGGGLDNKPYEYTPDSNPYGAEAVNKADAPPNPASTPDIGFEQNFPQIPPYGGSLPGQQPNNDFYSQYMSRYQPQHTAEDYYNQLAHAYPERPTSHSFMSKLAASMVGAGYGPKAADEVLDKDYNDQLADWKNQIGPAMNSANLERYMNVNERQLISNEALRESEASRANTAQQLADEKGRHDKANEERLNRLADVKEYLAYNDKYVPMKKKGGNVILYDPTDPTAPPIDTGIPEGTVSDIELQNIKNSAMLRRTQIMAGAGIQRAGITSQSSNTVMAPDPKDPKGPMVPWILGPDQQLHRVHYADESAIPSPTPAPAPAPGPAPNAPPQAPQAAAPVPPGPPVAGPIERVPKGGSAASGTKPITETQEAQRRLNEANKILQEDPSARDWITIGSDKRVTMDAEGKFGDADPATQAKFREWRNRIFKDNMIRVRSKISKNPDGSPRFGTVPADQFNPDTMEKVQP